MQKVRHHYFRWTPRTARITFTYVVLIPSIVGYAAYQTEVSRRRRPLCARPRTDWHRDSSISGRSGRATPSTSDRGSWDLGMAGLVHIWTLYGIEPTLSSTGGLWQSCRDYDRREHHLVGYMVQNPSLPAGHPFTPVVTTFCLLTDAQDHQVVSLLFSSLPWGIHRRPHLSFHLSLHGRRLD